MSVYDTTLYMLNTDTLPSRTVHASYAGCARTLEQQPIHCVKGCMNSDLLTNGDKIALVTDYSWMVCSQSLGVEEKSSFICSLPL